MGKKKEAQTPETPASEAQPATPEAIAQQDADDNAAFEAGFEGAHEEDSPTPKEPDDKAGNPEGNADGQSASSDGTDAQSAAQSTNADGTPANKADDTDTPVLANLTEPQLKALLAQAGKVADLESELRKVHGRFGEIKQKLEAQARQAPGPSMDKRQINAEALKRTKAEYPDMAALLAEDLSEMLQNASPTSGPTAEQINAHINQVVEQRVASVAASVNEEILSSFHEDWQAIRDSDDLQLWLGTQSADYREKFLQSNQAGFIAKGLDKFKEWRAQGQQQRQRNTNRLEQAITPRGGNPTGSPTALSDDAAFEIGFKTANSG